jgi:arylsulfatase A
VSSVDFLPTLCQAAGVAVPEVTDGVSFLPQLRGQKGTPREWLYAWYSPRQQADLSVHEFAFDHHYKLYRDGRFFDLAADPFEARPLESATLTEEEVSAAAKLRAVLHRFHHARPSELDRATEQSRQ